MTEAHRTTAQLDADVRAWIYDAFITQCTSATVSELAGKLVEPVSAIQASFARLAAAHLLVLQPESGEVLMAGPFSAVPTAFRVQAEGRAWWGNCIWDAMGVCIMTGADAAILTACPDCGEGLTLEVENSELRPAEGIVHFGVPAAHWWDDVGYT